MAVPWRPLVDDETIPNDEKLLRGIIVSAEWVVYNHDTGEPEVTSAAFKDGRTGEVSVWRASMKTPDEVLHERDVGAVAAVQAGVPRRLEHVHVVAIDDQEPDPAHRVIAPKKNIGKKQRAKAATALALAADWERKPPPRQA